MKTSAPFSFEVLGHCVRDEEESETGFSAAAGGASTRLCSSLPERAQDAGTVSGNRTRIPLLALVGAFPAVVVDESQEVGPQSVTKYPGGDQRDQSVAEAV
jgi:hypothetical protein